MERNEAIRWMIIRARRGFLIRDHYGRFDVVKVQLITDNLEQFLLKAGIEHKRTNFKKIF